MATATEQLATAADENLAVHAAWVQGRQRGMRVIDTGDLLIADGGLPCDTFNLVCRARLAPDRAAARIREAIAHFRGNGRPFSWWVGPGDQPAGLGDLLEQAGLARAETETAMVVDLERVTAPSVPAGLHIARAASATVLDDFARVCAANWTPPDPWVIRFYELAAPVLLRPDAPLWFYVGYVNGEPVATAEVTIGGGVAGLYNISTRAAFRRRGFGTALTTTALADARQAGHRRAILQAAPDGLGLYSRVGFEPFGEITEYKPRCAR